MALKPWYKIVAPRDDLKEGRPLDAAEFAVNLDLVRNGLASEDYLDPKQFFRRTYLTENLTSLAAEVVRRLSGERTQTSAVFNLATQFGGGKTHSLTLLYHLAKEGPAANGLPGVMTILNQSGQSTIPHAAIAIFDGKEFDSIIGRGGDDGTPLRKTPWGEIAYQLGGEEALLVLKEHEEQMTSPSGDVIRKFLPKNTPCLILMDELMNYVTRTRKSGMADQFYAFLHNLSEAARGMDKFVLVVSVPASEYEMTAADQADYDRIKKLLDRLGKPVQISHEKETAEIIRRRLFEWEGWPPEANKAIQEYGDWVVEHRQQLPSWFPIDNAINEFKASYPFHPLVISVFERKWRSLPRFQQTRGVLRLLALWVSNNYREGYLGKHKDSLIGLGTAPLDDSLFRAAVFEQLGESRLEAAVTTDICGKSDSHATRLDTDAPEQIKKGRLHRKIATTIFFESNGGQARAEATLPEIRLAVGEPELDIGNVETVLEALAPPNGACFYLDISKNRYWFSMKPNLSKVLADRKASVDPTKIEERLLEEIRKVFSAGSGIERVYFPTKSNQIPDNPQLKLIIVQPEYQMSRAETIECIERMTKEYGNSSRTFKSALIWSVADDPTSLKDDVRKVLAWEDIRGEKEELGFDESQVKQLEENVGKAARDAKENVWRTYKKVALLNKDNTIRIIDLGLVTSSSADSIVKKIIERLRNDGDITDDVSPNYLIRHWPPAFKEWSTRSVQNMFFASPLFPRLMNAGRIKDTIVRGVEDGSLAYVGKSGQDSYEPFIYRTSINPLEIEISDDMFIIQGKEAEDYLVRTREPPRLVTLEILCSQNEFKPGETFTFGIRGYDQYRQSFESKRITWNSTGGEIDQSGKFTAGDIAGSYSVSASVDDVHSSTTIVIRPQSTKPFTGVVDPGHGSQILLEWQGDITKEKWMLFFTKVLKDLAMSPGIDLVLNMSIKENHNIDPDQLREIESAMKELGISLKTDGRKKDPPFYQ